MAPLIRKEPSGPYRCRGNQVSQVDRLVGLPAAERDASRAMTLDGRASSRAALELVERLTADIYLPQVTKSGRVRKAPSKALTRAVGALVSDLLRNAQNDPLRWGWLQRGNDKFSGKNVGARTTREAFQRLAELGLVTFYGGHKQKADFNGGQVNSWGRATRMRATPDLFLLAADRGITPSNHNDHFAVDAAVEAPMAFEVLERRGASQRLGSGRYRGEALPLDLSDPAVAALHAQMIRINAFFAEQRIEGLTHRGFKRLFNDGDAAQFAWDQGGRLYSVGPENYQSAKKAERAKMLINGQSVVEIDVTASHLTILHALLGQPFNLDRDPYEVAGLPRELVKKWVTMTLGHTGIHARWPLSAKEDLKSTLGSDWWAEYPLSFVKGRLLRQFPALQTWGSNSVGWGRLQFVESCAMLEAVETLAFSHGVPALPIHDSLIAPEASRTTVEEVLSTSFQRHLGVLPKLKVS